jgi:drug/metabolite transporter superfamily protein YnfA
VRDDLSAAGVPSSGEVAAFLVERACWRLIALHGGIFIAEALTWIAATSLMLRLLDPALNRIGAFLILGVLVAIPG